ncbi:MAG TPA: hypothetical protein VJ807_12355 [Gaiellaceae bacterium]|nr:hypothetical protein [Gaiellaceae bacterium]
MRHITLIIAVIALALAAPAFSGKGGTPNGGDGNGGGKGNGGNGNGNVTVTYTPTLTANPNVVNAGDYFSVSGCGYNPDHGGVIVGFTGGSWGQVPSGGCIDIGGIPALSGDTLPAGTYPVTSYQYIDGGLTKVAETTVTVE